MPVKSPDSFRSSPLNTATTSAPGIASRAFKCVLPMNPKPSTATRIEIYPSSLVRHSLYSVVSVLRSLLLFLSRQSWLRHWMENSSAAARLTSRFIAGRTLEQEMAVWERLSREGIMATLARLGESDIASLCRQSIPVRLCKGAYKESSDVAFPDKNDVDRTYVRLMMRLLDDGVYPAIASHDERIIRRAVGYIMERKIASSRFEFQ